MATASLTPDRAGGRFWIGWMLATIAAAIIAMLFASVINFLMLHVPRPTESSLANSIASLTLMLVGSAMFGTFFGLAQWWVMRRYVPHAGAWVAATAIGYAVPLTAGPLLEQFFIAPWMMMTSMLLEFGLCIGVAQWWVLRRRVRRAGWWVPITLAGWVLAFGLTGAAYVTGVYVEPMDLLFAFIVPIAVSGAGMLWLLRQARPPCGEVL